MRIIIFLLSFLILGKLQSQDTILRNYATQKINLRLKKERGEVLQNQNKAEAFVATESKKIKFKKLKLPLVFHILYAAGKEYPSEKQVLSQIDALNRDFSQKSYQVKHPADTLEKFAQRVEDTEIEFCLAKNGPDGKNTAGIRYLQSSRAAWASNDSLKMAKIGVEPWDTEKYINVWVTTLADNVAGWAQMPGGPKETDGIVIDYRFLGVGGTAKSPYDEGKTLTHLIGSYLGLYELWNEANPCQDDWVEDTPIHNGPNFWCTPYKHVSLCDGNPTEMTMNFMDNTFDACLYMFTSGQKLRIQATLAEGGPRYGLSQTEVKCDKNGIQAEDISATTDLTPKLKLAPLKCNCFRTQQIKKSGF
ncbi:M43 family zinc metalloprotease [Haliscomenobacter hydrossis]|uniref:Peptidase M43 pregnancy-associated plasma-A domain-containing protein n=1 Tax=Haliscomenobacter hydrossis (strain ATCC 27775 / DSM 1100 / LMG 10767 / O) TaxID=760192 RepID=F4KYT2_HALH1|nr:M43 family zinc metalloprotease [Haliscomenobacter hydrossis]AEE51474.1 hypothetical protein Halhy_3622 [Haliscomenobacter hydrossis DSM 1100]